MGYDEFHTLLEQYHTRFGVRMGIPFGWTIEAVAEILQQAIESGVPVAEDRFDPPPGADS